MNARQKAKKYKRELDILKGQVIPFKIDKTQREVKTIEAAISYFGGPVTEDEVLPEIAEIISYDPEFRKSIEVDVKYIPDNDVYKIQGRVKVVMPDV